jgi:hypothetical protein
VGELQSVKKQLETQLQQITAENALLRAMKGVVQSTSTPTSPNSVERLSAYTALRGLPFSTKHLDRDDSMARLRLQPPLSRPAALDTDSTPSSVAAVYKLWDELQAQIMALSEQTRKDSVCHSCAVALPKSG